jgi:hypothetical protein
VTASTCPACGADKGTVGVVDRHLCLECVRREDVEQVTFSDRDFGVGVPGIIAEECYKLRDALHDKQEGFTFKPLGIFSKLDHVGLLRVRIDDALSHLMSDDATNEEVEQKLLECLVMLRVARRLGGS